MFDKPIDWDSEFLDTLRHIECQIAIISGGPVVGDNQNISHNVVELCTEQTATRLVTAIVTYVNAALIYFARSHLRTRMNYVRLTCREYDPKICVP